MTHSNVISMVFYRPYWYWSRFPWSYCGKLQDPIVNVKSKTLATMDDYSNNPWDESEERFSKLQAQVNSISHNMVIAMVDLQKFWTFQGVWFI
jgi:hypothetical protein